ncbi:hypothetical protein ACCO45_013399 [Purpureocillium lilacinum]|uniref:Uncharacterized protein n=1 Tax=Purpureocillium lilacinum TaxID=33203 RepID=A0ACC4D612_PURLI
MPMNDGGITASCTLGMPPEPAGAPPRNAGGDFRCGRPWVPGSSTMRDGQIQWDEAVSSVALEVERHIILSGQFCAALQEWALLGVAFSDRRRRPRPALFVEGRGGGHPRSRLLISSARRRVRWIHLVKLARQTRELTRVALRRGLHEDIAAIARSPAQVTRRLYPITVRQASRSSLTQVEVPLSEARRRGSRCGPYDLCKGGLGQALIQEPCRSCDVVSWRAQGRRDLVAFWSSTGHRAQGPGSCNTARAKETQSGVSRVIVGPEASREEQMGTNGGEPGGPRASTPDPTPDCQCLGFIEHAAYRVAFTPVANAMGVYYRRPHSICQLGTHSNKGFVLCTLGEARIEPGISPMLRGEEKKISRDEGQDSWRIGGRGGSGETDRTPAHQGEGEGHVLERYPSGKANEPATAGRLRVKLAEYLCVPSTRLGLSALALGPRINGPHPATVRPPEGACLCHPPPPGLQAPGGPLSVAERPPQAVPPPISARTVGADVPTSGSLLRASWPVRRRARLAPNKGVHSFPFFSSSPHPPSLPVPTVETCDSAFIHRLRKTTTSVDGTWQRFVVDPAALPPHCRPPTVPSSTCQTPDSADESACSPRPGLLGKGRITPAGLQAAHNTRCRRPHSATLHSATRE